MSPRRMVFGAHMLLSAHLWIIGYTSNSSQQEVPIEDLTMEQNVAQGKGVKQLESIFWKWMATYFKALEIIVTSKIFEHSGCGLVEYWMEYSSGGAPWEDRLTCLRQTIVSFQGFRRAANSWKDWSNCYRALQIVGDITIGNDKHSNWYQIYIFGEWRSHVSHMRCWSTNRWTISDCAKWPFSNRRIVAEVDG